MSDDQQPEFRSLSEIYIIICLNTSKLKIVENTKKIKHEKKIKIKRQWLRL